MAKLNYQKLAHYQYTHKPDLHQPDRPAWKMVPCTAKFNGRCAVCDSRIKKGDLMWFVPAEKKSVCKACGG